MKEKDTKEALEPSAINKSPRVSVNTLAEYIESNANRRKVIVGDCKNPKPFKATRYNEARKEIVAYLINGDQSILYSAIKDIGAKQDSSKFYDDDRNNSVDGLTGFLEFDYTLISDYQITENGKNTLLNIKGLQVSVNPEVLVRYTAKGQDQVGAIKLRILKTPMGKSQQETVALLIKRYLVITQDAGLVISNSLCLSIDVFANKVVPCPKAEIARMKLIESACEEILLRWPTV
jgi:hypothetical protein